jgi:oligopeptidase B
MNPFTGRDLDRPKAIECPIKETSWVTPHGDTIHDNYAWLTDKDDPEVMKYLEQENE